MDSALFTEMFFWTSIFKNLNIQDDILYIVISGT